MIPGYIAPEFELVRDDAACTRCRLCERECGLVSPPMKCFEDALEACAAWAQEA